MTFFVYAMHLGSLLPIFIPFIPPFLLTPTPLPPHTHTLCALSPTIAKFQLIFPIYDLIIYLLINQNGRPQGGGQENHKEFLHVEGGGLFSSDEKYFSPCGRGAFFLYWESFICFFATFFLFLWGLFSPCGAWGYEHPQKFLQWGGASPKTPLKTKKAPIWWKNTPIRKKHSKKFSHKEKM